MQNYYFVDFYICLWYSNTARRTKQNKAIGAKVLEKAKTNYPLFRLEKVIVLSQLYFVPWKLYTLPQKGCSSGKSRVEKGFSVHMSIINSSILIKGSSIPASFPHGTIHTPNGGEVRLSGYYTIVRRGRYAASIYKYRWYLTMLW